MVNDPNHYVGYLLRRARDVGLYLSPFMNGASARTFRHLDLNAWRTAMPFTGAHDVALIGIGIFASAATCAAAVPEGFCASRTA
jgi:hypothetical protein